MIDKKTLVRSVCILIIPNREKIFCAADPIFTISVDVLTSRSDDFSSSASEMELLFVAVRKAAIVPSELVGKWFSARRHASLD